MRSIDVQGVEEMSIGHQEVDCDYEMNLAYAECEVVVARERPDTSSEHVCMTIDECLRKFLHEDCLHLLEPNGSGDDG